MKIHHRRHYIIPAGSSTDWLRPRQRGPRLGLESTSINGIVPVDYYNMSDYDDLYSAKARDVTIVTSAYKVKASFRLFHSELDPERVTEEFGVCPTQAHRQGDQRTGKSGRVYSPYLKGGWILSSADKIRSLDANDHIAWVLDELAHCTTTIQRYREDGYDADVVCAWFAQSDNTCPILTAKTIRELARFSINFWFDIYLFPPDE